MPNEVEVKQQKGFNPAIRDRISVDRAEQGRLENFHARHHRMNKSF